MDFVIRVNGEPTDEGFWVLHVDSAGERFLLSGKDGAFRWVNMDACTLVRAANPDVPRPVVLIQPPRQGVAVPQLHMGNGRR